MSGAGKVVDGILRRRPCFFWGPSKGPKSPMQLASEMKAPVIGLYGEADIGIPVATVEALKAALAENKKTAEFRPIPPPRTVSTPTTASYRKEAAEDAWKEMQAWFKKYGVLS
jgi:carboxymethylenebutenolidase